MFEQSEADPSGSGKRWATMRGIAFAAQETHDGTWHGYPEPWNKVPADLKDRWLDEDKVTTASLKRIRIFPSTISAGRWKAMMVEFAAFGDPARFEIAVRWTNDAEPRARRPQHMAGLSAISG